MHWVFMPHIVGISFTKAESKSSILATIRATSPLLGTLDQSNNLI